MLDSRVWVCQWVVFDQPDDNVPTVMFRCGDGDRDWRVLRGPGLEAFEEGKRYRLTVEPERVLDLLNENAALRAEIKRLKGEI